MMCEYIRDSPAGQIFRWLTSNRVLLYPEEQKDFVIPPGFDVKKEPASSTELPSNEDCEKQANTTSSSSTSTQQPDTEEDGTIVGWYSNQDPENPQNWPVTKKIFVFFQLCLYTFAVYSGSAIITPAYNTFENKWGTSSETSSLVLSVYVLGYGIGPLVFSPLSEVPRLGRNVPYITTFTLFVIMSIPAALVNNYPGLVVLRFIQGFLGSPILATGGASAGDLFSFIKIPYAMSFWVAAAYAGPAFGPLLSGFAVMYSTWRWSMYELIIIGGGILALMFFFLPETNPETILLRRAQRLRKRTGNSTLKSQSEIKQGRLHFGRVVLDSLMVPFRIITQDPAVLFTNIYTSLTYAIYYSFFESFPIVYLGIYDMSLGIMGVVFLCLIISCAIGLAVYALMLSLHFEPYTISHGIGEPEHRLIPGIIGGIFLPAGLFIFGWTARSDINWVVPTIGIVIYGASMFLITQALFIYLPTSYPRYTASLFATNTLLRSWLAAGAIHFSGPLFGNLGIGRGCSILGGLNVGCLLGVTAIWHFGARLRAKSKFAEKY